ncbi:MAG: low temperature requirement protein A [Actinomycetota bacterium]|nr:low temperature requirement protein A [Actinomycetota bacterium]
MTVRARARQRESGEERVTPLELFFDLIFVFAITQVTGFVVDDPTWAGLAKGLLVLSVLWWAWAAYAWLTNTIDPEEGEVRIAMFAAMGAMLMASLAVPDAFGDDAFLFACAYGVVRLAHLALYAIAGWGDRDLLAAIGRLGAGTIASVSLLFVASALDGRAQVTVWAVAVVLDLLGAYIGGGRGWRLSAGHFAERHALVMIIALGESIVAIGLGATTDLSVGVIVAALLGLTIACALWWAYFDVVAIVAERKLSEATGRAQLTMARDSYSYLHLPMVAGIVLFAVGVKKTLGDVGEPLKLVPAATLCGGVALYLVAHVLFRLRNVRTLNKQRLVVSALLLAFLPLAVELPALASLGAVAALCIGLIAYEAIHFAEARDLVRHAPRAEAAS